MDAGNHALADALGPDFHTLLIRSSRNKVMQDIHAQLVRRTMLLRSLYFNHFDYCSLLDDHSKLVDLLEKRRVKQAMDLIEHALSLDRPRLRDGQFGVPANQPGRGAAALLAKKNPSPRPMRRRRNRAMWRKTARRQRTATVSNNRSGIQIKPDANRTRHNQRVTTMIKTTRREFLKYTGAVGTALAGTGFPSIVRAQEPLKIGQVNASPAAEIGWAKQHALGIDAIKAEFGDKVAVTVIDSIFMPQDAERVFRELASAGNKLIFGTSFSLGTPMQKVAPRFPEVAFEHCSGIVGLPNLGTFEAKYYEGAYVAGVAAGHMSKSGKLGFVGGFPIPDIIGPANAILLGAQSVNPAATCNVVYPQFLVRSGQGEGGGAGAAFAGLRRDLRYDRHGHLRAGRRCGRRLVDRLCQRPQPVRA